MFWLRASRRRDALVSKVLERVPGLAKVGNALPAKTLTLLTFTGTLSVIFATEPRVTLWTFGATCCALASSCETLALRGPVDRDIVATFSPIMSGTPRQKMRTLHVVLQSLAAGFAAFGAVFVSAARAHDFGWHWTAVVSGVFATAHDFLGFLAVVLLAVQVAVTARGDDEETVGHFAHDATCWAQIVTLLSEGIPALSTSLVAASVFLVWFSNATQVHQSYARPEASDNDPSYSPVPTTEKSASIIFSV
mmetsp:Transcript_22317/g.68693  ORF Transcript_22317/g.68693 Transcript_22317/m.68693 type:complete len:250 (-) Transcript_22317:165-914(-)